MNKRLLKLHNIFLIKYLILFLSIFSILGILFYFWTKDLYIKQTKIDLLHNIDIFSLSINSLVDLDDKVKNIKKLTSLRVTIINEKGIVLAESNKDKNSMDNHSKRDEIIQAKYQEYGEIIRYSNTLEKQLLYICKKYTIDNEDYYIRMSRDIKSIIEEFFILSLKVFFIFFIIAFLIAVNMNKNIEIEMKNISSFLKNLTKSNKAKEINSNYSIEFNKITKLLTNISWEASKRNKQKSKYTAKLRLSNKQKDEIISSISHEFKNPITVIMGYTQTLKEDKDTNTTMRHKFLEKISSNASKMADMIDRLRLSMNLENNKQNNKMAKINIKTLVKNQIEDIKLSYPNRNITFNGENIELKIDKTLIGIAIINLIENALKYSTSKIVIKLTNKKLSITDNGIGIAKKELDLITKKFYKISTNNWDNSFGIGLWIVLHIVKIHNFKLAIQSVKNKGSTFSILFT